MANRLRPRFFLRLHRGCALAYRKAANGVIRTLAGHFVTITYSFPDAANVERERACEDRNWTPPLVRDRKTLRAMERPAGPAGTRAEHKRPINTLDMIMREALMTRTRRYFQRQDGIERLRGLHPRLVRHVIRLGYKIPLDLRIVGSLTLRGEIPTKPWWLTRTN